MAASSFPVLSTEEVLERFRAKRAKTAGPGYFAFYSSWLGGITKDPAMMVAPFDDHMVHRGHGVFDTATLHEGKLYRLNKHLDRFIRSIQVARLEMPLSRERMVEAIMATCAASGQHAASVRYWLSAGPGDFSYSPKGCEPTFYCMVYGGVPMTVGAGIAECTVRSSEVPHKPALLAGCKSNNYMLNVLMHLASSDKGGRFGIGVDDDDLISEGAVVNATFIREDGVLMTPQFTRILAGCTVQRILQLAPRLVEAGLLKGIEQRDIKLEEAKKSREVFLSGGDTHIVPVVTWDGALVGDGKVGPVTTRIIELIEADMLENFDFEVKYTTD